MKDIQFDENYMFWPGEEVELEKTFEFKFTKEWNGNQEPNFKWLANAYYKCGELILNHAEKEGDDYDFKENAIFPGIYLVRHSMELYLKSQIKKSGHNLSKLLEENEKSLGIKTNDWLNLYICNLTKIDEGSDYFRYPVIKAKNENLIDGECETAIILDLNQTIENIKLAYALIANMVDKTDLQIDTSKNSSEFLVQKKRTANYSLKFIEEKDFEVDDFDRYIRLFLRVFYFLINDDSINNDQKCLPILFILRHTIEISIKKLICKDCIYKNGSVPKMKKYGHDLNSLFKKSKEIIISKCKGNSNVFDHDELSIVTEYIDELNEFFKDENIFRYPTRNHGNTYILKEKIVNIEKIIFESLKLINFYDGCDEMLEVAYTNC